jgi:hypothetical protein
MQITLSLISHLQLVEELALDSKDPVLYSFPAISSIQKVLFKTL